MKNKSLKIFFLGSLFVFTLFSFVLPRNNETVLQADSLTIHSYSYKFNAPEKCFTEDGVKTLEGISFKATKEGEESLYVYNNGQEIKNATSFILRSELFNIDDYVFFKSIALTYKLDTINTSLSKIKIGNKEILYSSTGSSLYFEKTESDLNNYYGHLTFDLIPNEGNDIVIESLDISLIEVTNGKKVFDFAKEIELIESCKKISFSEYNVLRNTYSSFNNDTLLLLEKLYIDDIKSSIGEEKEDAITAKEKWQAIYSEGQKDYPSSDVASLTVLQQISIYIALTSGILGATLIISIYYIKRKKENDKNIS